MKTKSNLLISVFAYLSAIINALNSDFISNTTFSSYQSISSVTVDPSDNSIYLYGQSTSTQVFLMKLASNGSQLWVSQFGNQTFTGEITAPQPQVDQRSGDVFVAGWTRTGFDGQSTTPSNNRPADYSTSSGQWYSVAWSPRLNLFVTVAMAGSNRALTSPDGIVWPRATVASKAWRSITWSNELAIFCAVSDGDQPVMTSPDGTTWTRRSTPSNTTTWTAIVWAPDLRLFVAVASVNTANTGLVMTSPNGIDWTMRTTFAGDVSSWSAITWSPQLTLFVAVANNGTSSRVMTSPDGIAWTSRTAPAESWASVAWSAQLELFCAVGASGGSQQIITSPDGITWTARTSPVTSTDLASVTYAAEPGYFIAVASVCTTLCAIYSTNGITWYTFSNFNLPVQNYRAIIYAPEVNTFVAVASAGSTRQAVSWQPAPAPFWRPRTPVATLDWRAVCWSPQLGLFAAVAMSGGPSSLMTSPDGVIWTARTTPDTTSTVNAITWSPERSLFVVVSYSGVAGKRVMTSSDGITWTLQNTPADNSWRSVVWAPGINLFVAVAGSGTGNRVMTSPDGFTWTTRTSAADKDWRSITYSPELGRLVAVAASASGSDVMTSSNGVSWALWTNPVNTWVSVCWSSELGLFVAVGEGANTTARVMTSTDGYAWVGRNTPGVNTWSAVIWVKGMGLFYAVSYSGTVNRVMTSPNGIDWTVDPYALNSQWVSIAWSPQLGVLVVTSSDGSAMFQGAYPEFGFICRFSSNGTRQWTRLLSWYGGNTRITSMEQLGNDLLIAGHRSSVMAINWNQNDGFLLRTSKTQQSSQSFSQVWFNSIPAIGNTGGDERVYALDVDTANNLVYVTGTTDATTFAEQSSAGQIDIFVTRFRLDNGRRLQSRLIGSAGADRALALAVDPLSSQVYIAGQASQAVSGTALMSTGPDQLVVALSTNVSSMSVQWIRFIGGTSADSAFALLIHPVTRDVIVGGQLGAQFPAGNSALQTVYYGGSFDLTLCQFSLNGTLLNGIVAGSSSNDSLSAMTFLTSPSAVSIVIAGQLGGVPAILSHNQLSVVQSSGIEAFTQVRSLGAFAPTAASVTVDLSSDAIYVYAQASATQVSLTKLASNGTQLWSSVFGSQTFAGETVAPQPLIDPQTGMVYVAGWTRGGFDSKTVTAPTEPRWADYSNIAWANDFTFSPELLLAVAASGNGYVLTSPNGYAWTQRTTPASGWTSIVWSSQLGIFVVCGSSGTQRIATSPDGINWTGQNSSAITSQFQWYSISWSPELRIFVAVAADNAVMTSYDGITWVQRPHNVTGVWYSVAWAAEINRFVAVGTSGSVTMYSNDGFTWLPGTSVVDRSWQSVAWSGYLGMFAAVAGWGTAGNRLMTSTNGINWIIRGTINDGQNWNSIIWAHEVKMFMASSLGCGCVMVSADGLTWTGEYNLQNTGYQSPGWFPPGGLAIMVNGLGPLAAWYPRSTEVGFISQFSPTDGNRLWTRFLPQHYGNVRITSLKQIGGDLLLGGHAQAPSALNQWDAFLLRVGKTSQYSQVYYSYWGTVTTAERLFAVEIDYSTNTVYSVGTTTATTLYSQSSAGGADIFIAKHSIDTGKRLSLSLMGSAQDDLVTAIVIDQKRNALYLTGAAGDFFVQSQATLMGAGQDQFVMKLSLADLSIQWLQYLGGYGGTDMSYGLAIHPLTGNVVSVGQISSALSASTSDLSVNYIGGASDLTMTTFSQLNGSRLQCLIAGSFSGDNLLGVDVQTSGTVVMVGSFNGSAAVVYYSPPPQYASRTSTATQMFTSVSSVFNTLTNTETRSLSLTNFITGTQTLVQQSTRTSSATVTEQQTVTQTNVQSATVSQTLQFTSTNVQQSTLTATQSLTRVDQITATASATVTQPPVTATNYATERFTVATPTLSTMTIASSIQTVVLTIATPLTVPLTVVNPVTVAVLTIGTPQLSTAFITVSNNAPTVTNENTVTAMNTEAASEKTVTVDQQTATVSVSSNVNGGSTSNNAAAESEKQSAIIMYSAIAGGAGFIIGAIALFAVLQVRANRLKKQNRMKQFDRFNTNLENKSSVTPNAFPDNNNNSALFMATSQVSPYPGIVNSPSATVMPMSETSDFLSQLLSSNAIAQSPFQPRAFEYPNNNVAVANNGQPMILQPIVSQPIVNPMSFPGTATGFMYQ